MVRARVAVLGGGITGITAAYRLAHHGYSVVLFDQAGLGGLLRSVEVEGIAFDIGSFVFLDSDALFEVFPVLRECFVRVPPRRLTLTGRGRVDSYPISLGGFVRDNGVATLGLGLIDLLYCRLRYRSTPDARTFALRHMGGLLYRQSGLKHYMERLYGLPDDAVSAEFAQQRLSLLPQLTPASFVRWEVAQLRRANRNDPVSAALGTDTVLVRPREGFPVVFSILQGLLAAAGVEVCLNTPLLGVDRRGARYGVWTSRGDEAFDAVVSTIPMDTILRAMGEEPDDPLERINLLSLFYRGKLLPDAGCLYNFTPRGRWKRVIVFSKFYGELGGEDYFTVEITTRETNAATRAALRADFEQHVRDLGLFAGGMRWLGECVTEGAYPVFRRGCTALVENRRRRLESQGIHLAGRQGRFEYISVNLAVRQARALAENMSRDGQPFQHT